MLEESEIMELTDLLEKDKEFMALFEKVNEAIDRYPDLLEPITDVYDFHWGVEAFVRTMAEGKGRLLTFAVSPIAGWINNIKAYLYNLIAVTYICECVSQWEAPDKYYSRETKMLKSDGKTLDGIDEVRLECDACELKDSLRNVGLNLYFSGTYVFDNYTRREELKAVGVDSERTIRIPITAKLTLEIKTFSDAVEAGKISDTLVISSLITTLDGGETYNWMDPHHTFALKQLNRTKLEYLLEGTLPSAASLVARAGLASLKKYTR